MKTQNLNYFLTVLLIAASGGLVFMLLRPAQGQRSPVAKAKPSAPSVMDPVVALKATFYDIYPSLVLPDDGFKLKDTDSILTADKKFIPFSKLIGNGEKLVFRYSYIDCDVCVDSVLSAVQRITKKNKLDKLIVLTDTKTERDFLLKNQYKKHPYPVYALVRNKLGLTMENKNLPFLFLVSPDMKVSKVFIPFKESHYQTQQYLGYMFKYLNVI